MDHNTRPTLTQTGRRFNCICIYTRPAGRITVTIDILILEIKPPLYCARVPPGAGLSPHWRDSANCGVRIYKKDDINRIDEYSTTLCLSYVGAQTPKHKIQPSSRPAVASLALHTSLIKHRPTTVVRTRNPARCRNP